MKTVIGLALGFDSARAVALQGGKIAWIGETALDTAEGMAQRIAELLKSAPRKNLGRPRVVAAIGPAFAQTRIISGLPPLNDVRILSRIISEGTSRFFLRNGTPLLTGSVQCIEPGRVWASAFDEYAVNAVLEGCAASGCRVVGIAPTVAVLGAGLRGDRLSWADGPVAAEIELEDGELVAVRRRPRNSVGASVEPEACQALAALGDGSCRFADAYGAAVLAPNPPLALRPGGNVANSSIPRWRIALAASIAGVALILAMATPGWMASRTARNAEARLADLAEARNAAAVADGQLKLFSSVLDEVARFDRDRRSITFLLAEITRALPEGHALLTLQVDSAGGTIVAVASESMSVMAALQSIRGIASAEVVEPVTAEWVGDRELTRVTVRFLWPNGTEVPAETGDGGEAD